MAITVTVVTVVRNGKGTIESTINSVRSQSYKTIEHLVIDGMSDDGSVEIIQKYDKLRLLSEADEGIYDAMNKGIRESSGDYVLFMNCGDVFYDESSLQKLVNAIDVDDVKIVLGGWVRKSGVYQKTMQPDLIRGVFNHQAILYSKYLHIKFGPYLNRANFIVADYEFFTRVLGGRKINTRTVSEPVAVIDVFGVSLTEHNFSQKTFIDFVNGDINKFQLLIYLSLHPLYFFIKRFLRGRF